jgi:serine/threonine-protein kinase
MGEVYRATDTRLGRRVAIKILPSHVVATPELRRRFEQEARAASALNHPHICALYDIGREAEIDYLVLEYVEGEPLADIIARPPLPLPRALQHAIEIADALAEAHRHGIVHRDLKPANIVIGAKGAKLLDFGLAKHIPIGFASSVSDAVTAAALTNAGTIVGTLQYMAPEQLEGKDADARSDIFAFGAVLYEMLTGRRAFDAPTQPGVIASIVSAFPCEPSAIRPDVPRAVDHVVGRCLSKNPLDRWQSATDVKFELEWIARGPADAQPAPTARWNWLRLGLVVTVAVVAIAGVLAVLFTGPDPGAGVTRFTLVPAHAIAPVAVPVAIARDGSRIAYVDRDVVDPGTVRGPDDTGVARRVYLKRLDRFDEQVVSGTDGATSSTFSPDGSSLGIVVEGRVKIIPVAGGPAVTIAENAGDFGIDWAADDTIVYTSSKTWGLMRVPAGGGTAQVLTTPDATRRELRHTYPQVLPGGRAVVFTVSTGLTFDATHVVALSLDTGRQTTVLEDGRAARYTPSGHLVFLRGPRLYASPFDVSRLVVTGSPTPILESVRANSSWGTSLPFALSDSGHLVYVPADQPYHEIVWVSRNGQTTPLGIPKGSYSFPVLSPDGRYFTITIQKLETRGADVAVFDVNRATLTPLTTGGFNHIGIWMPDGEWIVFSSDRNGSANLFRQPRDGSLPAEQLVQSPQHQDPGSSAPDGQLIVYAEADPANKWDLWMLPLAEPRTPKLFRRTPANEYHPAISPDGGWIAYTSDESGRSEVFIEAFPGGGKRQQVSTAGGYEPFWARGGGVLYFRSSERMLAVDVTRLETGAPVIGTPQVLFSGRFQALAGQGWPNYSVAPDGNRFLMIHVADEPTTNINVVQHWTEELKRLVPTN